MLDRREFESEQQLHWRCGDCGFSKPISQFDTGELFRGETTCQDCARIAVADRKRIRQAQEPREFIAGQEELLTTDGFEPSLD